MNEMKFNIHDILLTMFFLLLSQRVADVTEFPAVPVSVDKIVTDGVRRGVHAVTVLECQYVQTYTRVNGRTVILVRKIATVIVSVTFVTLRNTLSLGAFKLGGWASTAYFVTSVTTVVVIITLISRWNALGISTRELA